MIDTYNNSLAQQFAQVRDTLRNHHDSGCFVYLSSGACDCGVEPNTASLAALSSIERHVQELELELDETGECRKLCTPEARRHVQDMEKALEAARRADNALVLTAPKSAQAWLRKLVPLRTMRTALAALPVSGVPQAAKKGEE